MKLYYFAYGSNMCTGRLRARVPSARSVFITQLSCHTLKFHKRSEKDRSAKADAEYTGRETDVLWGIIFEIDAAQKQQLDDAEGLGIGYEEKTINFKDCTGRAYTASMYFAWQTHIVGNLRPYSWYLRFVLEGAKQHGLPPDYVELLEVETTEDPDRARDTRERAVSCN
ncbi:MAG: gamma-glutamylcyclotransferase family protein [Candidatus Acidiferrales bacterium]